MSDNWLNTGSSSKYIVQNSDLKLTQNITIVNVSYENSSWKYTLASMVSYALQPIIVPAMILLSKVLKRRIEWVLK